MVILEKADFRLQWRVLARQCITLARAALNRRAGRVAGGVVWPEPDRVDEKLRAPAAEVRQRAALSLRAYMSDILTCAGVVLGRHGTGLPGAPLTAYTLIDAAMSLNSRSINKLLKEACRGTRPMTVEPAAREQLGNAITRQLERIEGVETKVYHYLPEAEKSRLVCAFSVLDPEPRYYYASRNDFFLLLDENSTLTIRPARDSVQAVVSSPDEIVQFILHCKQRLARRRALKAKREKVRELRAQAIIAQVKQLAKEDKFDFMTATDSQKLRLFVKLSNHHCLELHIPLQQFQQMLPHLRGAIASLRQLYENGWRFNVTSNRALSWQQSWVSHASL
jgi:hypothetical protein